MFEDSGIETLSGLRRALRAMLAYEDARRLDHMIRLGRLTAYEKAAHFILEMQHRSGAADARSFPLPLTQEMMADALGLSVVHTNRTLQHLRRDKMIETHGSAITILQPEALEQVADFREPSLPGPKP